MNFSGGVLTVFGPNETASIFATYPSEYISLGRSFLDQVNFTHKAPSFEKPLQSTNVSIYFLECPLGGGYWHADVVHPWFGRAEKHSGPCRAHPRSGGCHRPGHLHVHVCELRRCHQPCSGPGTPPLYADCRLGHRGLYVSRCRPRSIAQERHFHFNRTFTELGLYCVGVTAIGSGSPLWRPWWEAWWVLSSTWSSSSGSCLRPTSLRSSILLQLCPASVTKWNSTIRSWTMQWRLRLNGFNCYIDDGRNMLVNVRWINVSIWAKYCLSVFKINLV